MSTHNVCYVFKNTKIRYTPANPSFSTKKGFMGVYFSRTYFPDGMPLEFEKQVQTNRFYKSFFLFL